MRTFFTFVTVLISSSSLFAQTEALAIQNSVRWPKDSIDAAMIIAKLPVFLRSIELGNDSTPFIPDTLKAETYVLLDEMRGTAMHETTHQPDFYKPTLINIVNVFPHHFLIQLQFAAVTNNTVNLRAIFELMAHVDKGVVYIYSPLQFYTKHFKRDVEQFVTFVYPGTINQDKVSSYKMYKASFDEKIGLKNKQTIIYCCENLPEMQGLVGVVYKSDYSGRRNAIWSANYANQHIQVMAYNNAHFDQFDPHDLFHERISVLKPRSALYRPADEGCAYLYGGSWGFSWEEILKQFKTQMADQKIHDWIQVKEKPLYFKTAEFSNSADYIVMALIVRELEKKRGFPAVLDFLNLGPQTAGHEKFYAFMEKEFGIKKKQYNVFVDGLIAKAGQ